ncbi:MAG: hypothetical protein KF686_13500 [Ramlibacter sp.]|nr:hypothetical protein [Ramlibacter sp.]
MATTAPIALPDSFEVPFRVVQQETRHDCILAAIATLTGKTLEEVWAAAYKLGLPKIGVYYVSEDMIAKLLMQLGGLVATVWKDFTSFDALDDVCLLWVDVDKKDPDTGRTVIFHHVRAFPPMDRDLQRAAVGNPQLCRERVSG